MRAAIPHMRAAECLDVAQSEESLGALGALAGKDTSISKTADVSYGISQLASSVGDAQEHVAGSNGRIKSHVALLTFE